MNPLPPLIHFESAVPLPRFQTKAGEQAIDPKRIVYLSAQGNYTLFHLENGEQVVTSLSLSSYACLLEKHGFLRLHKSHLLNLHYLGQCIMQRFMFLILPGGQTIEIARRRRKTLKKILKGNK
ncbi:MAG: LytTR family DNA-binding domain-containing protein [Spirosomataceae bacterium]